MSHFCRTQQFRATLLCLAYLTHCLKLGDAMWRHKSGLILAKAMALTWTTIDCLLIWLLKHISMKFYSNPETVHSRKCILNPNVLIGIHWPALRMWFIAVYQPLDVISHSGSPPQRFDPCVPACFANPQRCLALCSHRAILGRQLCRGWPRMFRALLDQITVPT